MQRCALQPPQSYAPDLQRGRRTRPSNPQRWICRSRPIASSPGRCLGRRRRQSSHQKSAPALIRARSSLVPPLGPEVSIWQGAAVLTGAAAGGSWLEKNTSFGRALSAPLAATLLGLLARSLGLIDAGSPALKFAEGTILPIALPLLLFSANLGRILSISGILLAAFAIAALSTLLATLLLQIALPSLVNWEIASALAARHIGGAANYVAVTSLFQLPAADVAAVLAADNVVCAAYFATIFVLARSWVSTVTKEPSREVVGLDEPSTAVKSFADMRPDMVVSMPNSSQVEGSMDTAAKMYDAILALAVSMFIIFLSVVICAMIGAPERLLVVASAVTVLIATFFPAIVGPLAEPGSAVGLLLLQFFFANVGAAGDASKIFGDAFRYLVYSALQIFLHLGFALSAASFINWIFKRIRSSSGDQPLFPRKIVLLASNASVGGPSTAAGLAATMGWKELIAPAVLVGVLGYATGTFASIALGYGILRHIPIWY